MFIMEGSGAEADGAEESKMLLVLILERTESSDDATFSLSLCVTIVFIRSSLLLLLFAFPGWF